MTKAEKFLEFQLPSTGPELAGLGTFAWMNPVPPIDPILDGYLVIIGEA